MSEKGEIKKLGTLVLNDEDKYGKDGRKLNFVESLVFHILRNADKKYGVKKETLYEKLMQKNPFTNIKNHSITSMAILKHIKDSLRVRLEELQENLKSSMMTDNNNPKAKDLRK
jgi:hypothetical protein